MKEISINQRVSAMRVNCIVDILFQDNLIIEFHLIEINALFFLKESTCSWCKTNKVFKPHSFAVIGGGALLQTREGIAGPINNMECFLHLSWHGPHSDDGGSGTAPNTNGTVEIYMRLKQITHHLTGPGEARHY